jgi:hypothetical protein
MGAENGPGGNNDGFEYFVEDPAEACARAAQMVLSGEADASVLLPLLRGPLEDVAYLLPRGGVERLKEMLDSLTLES